MRVRCTTIFDITKTNISGRRQHLSPELAEQTKERSQQANLETLLQIISLRSQPENITDPVVVSSTVRWGTRYHFKKVVAWTFIFEVAGGSQYFDDGDIFGHLKKDCSGVPMLTGLDESGGLINTLDCSPEFKNIDFEELND